MSGVIYLIRNSRNGKCYIGKTFNLERRIRQHFTGHSSKCRALNNAVKKYGKNAFTYEILHEGIIPELLSDFEIQAIRKYNTKAPNGYNLTDGGEGIVNPSEEIRQKRRLSNRHPNYEEVHLFYLSLPPDMHLYEKRRLLRKKFTGIVKATINNWVRDWSGVTYEKHTKRHLDYEKAYLFYMSLPQDMDLYAKRRLICEKFTNVNKSSIYNWFKAWTNKSLPRGKNSKPAWNKGVSPSNESVEKLSRSLRGRQLTPSHRENISKGNLGRTVSPETRSKISMANRHPDYAEVYQLFISLPPDMDLSKKRHLLFQRFPSIKKSAINMWLRKWTGIKTGNKCPRNPNYSDVHNLFLTLPAEMNLADKRKRLYTKFPNISQGQIWRWTKKWQPEGISKLKHSRQEFAQNKAVAYNIFISLFGTTSLREIRKILRDRFPDHNHSTICNWVNRWQSSLDSS